MDSNYQITLKDFNSEEIFVFLRQAYKSNLLKGAISKAGSQRLLANLIKEKLKYQKIKQSDISSFLYKKNLRLDLVYWLCKFTNIKFDVEQIRGIKGVQTSKMIYNPKLDIKLSIELAQILANLYCDGSIEKNNCHVSTYMNGYNELVDRFKSNFVKCFGEVDFYERETNVNNVRIPCFIGEILYNKFRLDENKVPIQIKNSSKNIKATYLQAVFDDEGSIHKTYCQIRIKMKPKSYIEDIQKLIREWGIDTSSVIEELDKRHNRKYYFFLISGFYNLKKFSEEIGFFHPKKKMRLLEHLNNVKTLNYGYKAKNLVLSVLRKYGPSTVKEIAKKLDRNKRVINTHLNNLKKQNLVSYTKLKRKFVYEYLWKIL
jgi:intein/homing endonuclease